MSEENVEIVRRVVEAFEEGREQDDPAVAFDSAPLAADVEWITPPGLGLPTYRGRDGFLEFMRTWTEDFEDFSVELERLIDADDDRVVGLFHQRATGKGSGVPVDLHMAVVYEIEDGRGVRMRNFVDPTEALKAAGLSE